MTVAFIDTWVPNGPFEIARNGDVRGGIQIVATADITNLPVVDSGSTANLTDPVIAFRADIENISGTAAWMKDNAWVQLSGTAGGTNDGVYAIESVLSATSVRVIGSFSFPEANNGSLVWEINPTSDIGLLTVGVATWLREPGMVARVSPPEIGVDILVNGSNDWELRKDVTGSPIWQDRVIKPMLINPPPAILSVEASGGDPIHKAYTVHGCGLNYRTSGSIEGGFYKADAEIESGMLVLADGRVVRVESTPDVDFGIGATPAAGLDGVTPAFPAFIYYYVYAPTGSDPTLTYSTSGPDGFNRPSTTPSLGNKNDYMYVGLLRWHDYRVATGTDAWYELAREARAFESVIGNKRARTVYFSDPLNDADFRQTDSDSGTKTRYTAKNFIATNPAPLECDYVIFDNEVTVLNLEVTQRNHFLKMGGGIARRLQLQGSATEILRFQTMSPRAQLTTGSSAGWGILEPDGTTGNTVFTLTQALVGGVEFVD